MTKFYISILLSFIVSGIFAQIPAGYYNGTSGLTGNALKSKLHTIIRGHTKRSYYQLWTDFQTTDKKANGYVWDMYSDVPGGTPSYDYTYTSDQCGTYSGEGSCYNREHSFPKSWWGGAQDTMYTDLFHLVPTDGYVNSKRSNHPFGEVGTATWISSNGCKVGPSNYPGYSGTVFEPIDAYKGDFARAYFYIATRYMNKIDSWASNPNTDMLDGSGFSPWAENLLLDWNAQDPVSQKEEDRNDAIYGIQGNRNPFIDHPTWVNDIWNPSPNNAPIYAAGYPKSDNITNTTFDLLVKQNKVGIAYYVVLADGSSTPSSSQVKNGADANGTSLAANKKGSISVATANTQYSSSISGLSLGTDYDIYVVSEDNSSPTNLQSSPAMVEVLTTGGGGSGSTQTYTENFDDNSAWSSGSGYNNYTYTSSSASHNDWFTMTNCFKETSDVNSAPNSCRLKNAANASLRYECEGTVSSFSVYAARWDNSPKPNVTVRYSVDGGSNFTTAFTFTGDDFSGDKIYEKMEHIFSSPITNNSGSKIYIEFVTNSGERMFYDDFEIVFGSSGSSNSTESNIVKNATWTEPQNIAYASYTAASGLTTSNSIKVAMFTLQDGGNDNTDIDAVSTILSNIEFTIDNYDNLDAIALFDGNTKLAEITNVTSTVSFSGLSIEALDESSQDFSVYISFKTAVTDNENLQLSISSVTADANGSSFAANDGGGAASDNLGDNNKIEVTANHLAYIANKPPTSVNTNTDFEVEVEALDANDNRDLDAQQSVSISLASGSGVLSAVSGLSKTLNSGLASWTDMQYDTGEDITISASANSFSSITSSTITVTATSSINYFTDLIISEYVEGSSNNKYLEIWNNTGTSVSLSDYHIDIYFNGQTTVGKTINLTGTLADQAVFVIAKDNATAWSGTPDLPSPDLLFNGDDAVALVNTNAKGNIDVIGVIGNGSNYAKDKTLERNTQTTGPSSTYNASEWDTKAKDNVSGLGNPGPLPIDLLSFTAKRVAESIQLNWQTASETNNNFFTLERATDAEHFETIAHIDGAGNSNTLRNYTYSDNLISGVNILYYRLKQTDFDGHFTYSKTVFANSTQKELIIQNTYINSNKLFVIIFSPEQVYLDFELFSMNGQSIISKQIALTKGENHIEIALTNIPHAIYLARFSTMKFIETRRILHQ